VVGLCDQWWTCCKNIIQHSVIKHNVGAGSSQSAHVPVMDGRSLKVSMCSWLQWLITILIPVSVTLGHQWIVNSFKCLHLSIQTQRQPYPTAIHRHLHFMFKTTFRHVNMLTYCTFLQFLPTLHYPDWGIVTGSTILWKTWKVDEETWTMLGQSNCDRQRDAKM
jgi:hypothetical protein